MPSKLLAGPILRRTTHNRVCVWLATPEPKSLQLTVTNAQGNIVFGQSDPKELDKQCVQLGKNIWIYLLQGTSNRKAKLKTGQAIDRNTCHIMIATTPVMGFSTIEFMQQFCLWLTGLIESFKPIHLLERAIGAKGVLTGFMVNRLDAESWRANKEGFTV